MAFLTLNGVTLAIVGTPKRNEAEIGEGPSRAYSGGMLRSTQGYKRHWSLSTQPLVQAESVAWVQLLQGRHDHWSFNATKYSDKGMVASSDVGTTITATTPKWGAGSLNIPSGTSNLILFATNVGTTFTLTVWRLESGVWVWYWITYNGGTVAVYRNGTLNATALPAWLGTASGAIQLTGIAGTAFQYDDLVIYPVVLPLSWQASMYAFAQSQAFPFAPQLQLIGDITPAAALVLGTDLSATDAMGALPGAGFADNNEPLDFTLQEA